MTTNPKLSQIMINQAYDMYYHTPNATQQPTMQFLANLFHVSTNTMFIALNREKQRREQPLTTPLPD